MLVRILTFSCQYKFCFITFRIPRGCIWCFLPAQSACYLLAGCHYLFWSMSFEYIIHSDYWPKYHFQHSPSVWSSVNSSPWLSLCLRLVKIPLLSLQCSLQFSPKIPGKSIRSPGGDFCSSTHRLTCGVTSLTVNRENNWAAQVVQHSCICRPK